MIQNQLAEDLLLNISTLHVLVIFVMGRNLAEALVVPYQELLPPNLANFALFGTHTRSNKCGSLHDLYKAGVGQIVLRHCIYLHV